MTYKEAADIMANKRNDLFLRLMELEDETERQKCKEEFLATHVAVLSLLRSEYTEFLNQYK